MITAFFYILLVKTFKICFLSLSVSDSFYCNCFHILRSFCLCWALHHLWTEPDCHISYLEAIFALSSTLKTPALITLNLTNVHCIINSSKQACFIWQCEPAHTNHICKKKLWLYSHPFWKNFNKKNINSIIMFTLFNPCFVG